MSLDVAILTFMQGPSYRDAVKGWDVMPAYMIGRVVESGPHYYLKTPW